MKSTRLGLAAVVGCVLLAAGCGPRDRRAPDAPMPDIQVNARALLDDALASGQPPLQALALEAYLAADLPGPDFDLRPTLDPRVRMLAYVLAARRHDPQAVAYFRRDLRGADPAVRLASAFGLALAGEGGQAIALRDGLASPDVTVRRNAAWLIGLMDNKSAIEMLKTPLADPDAVVALRAAEAMARLGSRGGLDVVRQLTEHERHPVRYWATRLLGRIGTADDIPRLQRLCDDSRFLDVKFAAIAALAQRGDLKRIQMLVELLDAKEPDLKALAAGELGETGYGPALPALARLAKDKDLALRTTVAAAILRIQAQGRSWHRRGNAEPSAVAPLEVPREDLPKFVSPLAPRR
jgi:HEAT repeat protein